MGVKVTASDEPCVIGWMEDQFTMFLAPDSLEFFSARDLRNQAVILEETAIKLREAANEKEGK